MSSPSNTPTPQRTYASVAATSDRRAQVAATASSAEKANLDKTPTPTVELSPVGMDAPPPFFPQVQGSADQGHIEPATIASIYRPPQARGDDEQPPAKVTRTFAQMATNHSNTHRNMSYKPVTDDAALHAAAAAALYLQSASGLDTAPVLPVDGSSRRVSDGQGSAAIGDERQSRSLALTNVPQRRVLAATLSLVRSFVVKKVQQDPALSAMLHFLDQVFPRGGQADTTYDAVLSNIEVAYRYPVDDANWRIWEEILECYPLAKHVDQTLAVGAGEFDQVNSTFSYNAHLVNSGDAPEKLLSQLVAHYNLDKKFDVQFHWGDGQSNKNKEP